MSANPGELEKLLAENRRKTAEKVPPEVLETMKNGLQEIASKWAADRAPQAGQKARDFTLPSVGGEQVQLSSLLRNGPVVLAFYRGGW